MANKIWIFREKPKKCTRFKMLSPTTFILDWSQFTQFATHLWNPLSKPNDLLASQCVSLSNASRKLVHSVSGAIFLSRERGYTLTARADCTVTVWFEMIGAYFILTSLINWFFKHQSQSQSISSVHHLQGPTTKKGFSGTTQALLLLTFCLTGECLHLTSGFVLLAFSQVYCTAKFCISSFYPTKDSTFPFLQLRQRHFIASRLQWPVFLSQTRQRSSESISRSTSFSIFPKNKISDSKSLETCVLIESVILCFWLMLSNTFWAILWIFDQIPPWALWFYVLRLMSIIPSTMVVLFFRNHGSCCIFLGTIVLLRVEPY